MELSEEEYITNKYKDIKKHYPEPELIQFVLQAPLRKNYFLYHPQKDDITILLKAKINYYREKSEI